MKNQSHVLNRLWKKQESEWLEQIEISVRFRVLAVDRMALELEISSNLESYDKMGSP